MRWLISLGLLALSLAGFQPAMAGEDDGSEYDLRATVLGPGSIPGWVRVEFKSEFAVPLCPDRHYFQRLNSTLFIDPCPESLECDDPRRASIPLETTIDDTRYLFLHIETVVVELDPTSTYQIGSNAYYFTEECLFSGGSRFQLFGSVSLPPSSWGALKARF